MQVKSFFFIVPIAVVFIAGNISAQTPQRTVSSIEVVTPPDKTDYYPGEDLDLGGIEVRVVYSDRSARYEDITIENISGYDKNRLGSQTVTVNFEGQSAVFSVFVLDTDEAGVTLITVVQRGSAGRIRGYGNAGVFITRRTVELGPYSIARYELSYDIWYSVYQWAVSSERGNACYTFTAAGREGNGGVDGAAPTADAAKQPVTNMTWEDALLWCNAYSEMNGLKPAYTIRSSAFPVARSASGQFVLDISAEGYRLPTEAEWEFAARGAEPEGPDWNFTVAGSNNTSSVAWFKGNSGGNAHGIGLKPANRLGLFDMSGNVWEWCWDTFGPIQPEIIANPSGGEDYSLRRVVRGGSFFNDAAQAAVTYRASPSPGNFYDNIGIRLVRSLTD
ncbi:hypothetical protein FACS1894151_05570 [Spirochaetia bacterium]|nr:hypothetical protein FACS1894151_05570 [Spirochaetia bacterium]